MLFIFVALVLVSMEDKPSLYPEKLSAFGFFKNEMKMQLPEDGVVPYALATPLFSDYAEKLRFVRVPKGSFALFNDSTVFDFPIGTALIKTFYFPIDFRNPNKGRRLMETRVLLHENKGWVALPYIWNADQTDAILSVAGETLQASYIDGKGKKKSYEYLVPNVNQCKGCHNRSEQMMPIGPSARQLNHEIQLGENRSNQLEFWTANHMLEGIQDIKKLHTS
ncbi:MAG: hypothetical protein ACO29O_04260, partial [Chitinophagaceae bacterium]